MANLRAVPNEPLAEGKLEDIVKLHLIGAVQFGYVTIRYEHGHPTMVERFEQVRLTGNQQKPV
jgi:hypothetical protein